MAKCWEEYMEKVHDAIALDPWASEVQLLDIFVGKRRGKGWLRRLLMLPRRKMMTAMREVERAGSMLNLGAAMEEEGEGGRSWREEMEEERREGQEEMMREEEEEAGPPSEKTSSSSSSSDSSQKPQDQTSSSSTQKTITLTTTTTSSSSSSEKSHSSQQTPHKSRNKKPNKRSLMFRVLSMADMQTSIKTSSSALTSLMLSSDGGSVDLDGARSVSCTVSGVKSHSVSMDRLMDQLVSCSWTPNISRPELAWDFKRGQTLWVVTEILYAKKINVQGDIKTNVESKANLQATITNNVDVNASTKVKVERDGAWVVTAPKDKLFPFAFRVKQLDYDAAGVLKSNTFLLRRNGSLNNVGKLLPPRSMIQPQQIFNHNSVRNSSGSINDKAKLLPSKSMVQY